MRVLTRAKVYWLMGLAMILLAGCLPTAHFDIGIGIRPTITASSTATPPPTETLTPTSTGTATETMTSSPTPESFPIDKAKLFNNMPKSYEELIANLGNYVEAPDAATPEFMDWWKNKLLPALGPEADLPRNAEIVMAPVISQFNDLMLDANTATAKSLLNPPEFFYFQHEGKVYPVLVLSTVSYEQGTKNIVTNGTITVILTESTLMGMGWDSLANLAAGKPIISVIMFPNTNDNIIPDDCRIFVSAGLDGSVYYEPGSTPEPVYDASKHHWWIPACGRIQTSIAK